MAEGWTGISIGLNHKYSHPVCMRLHSHMHATINDTQENSWGLDISTRIGY